MMVLLFFILVIAFALADAQPMRLAVAGISHGHVSWILGRKNDEVVQLVGVYEPDKALVDKMVKRFNLDPKLFYTDLNRMLDEIKPEGVSSFGTTLQHLQVVEACAPRGIHVMVEKPLATTVADAERIASLANKHRIHVLTNYETSWYPTTDKTLATSWARALRSNSSLRHGARATLARFNRSSISVAIDLAAAEIRAR